MIGRRTPSTRLADPRIRTRDELGFLPGVELELAAVNGRLEVAVASRVQIEEGPHGIRFAAHESDALTTERVREQMERGRR